MTDPSSQRGRADLARVFAYFDESRELTDAERAWVQDRGLAILYAELLRLRAALARRAGGSL